MNTEIVEEARQYAIHVSKLPYVEKVIISDPPQSAGDASPWNAFVFIGVNGPKHAFNLNAGTIRRNIDERTNSFPFGSLFPNIAVAPSSSIDDPENAWEEAPDGWWKDQREIYAEVSRGRVLFQRGQNGHCENVTTLTE